MQTRILTFLILIFLIQHFFKVFINTVKVLHLVGYFGNIYFSASVHKLYKVKISKCKCRISSGNFYWKFFSQCKCMISSGNSSVNESVRYLEEVYSSACVSTFDLTNICMYLFIHLYARHSVTYRYLI